MIGAYFVSHFWSRGFFVLGDLSDSCEFNITHLGQLLLIFKLSAIVIVR